MMQGGVIKDPPPLLIITFQQCLLYILIFYFHVFRRVWQCWEKLEQTSKPQPGKEIFKYKIVKWARRKLNIHCKYASIWIFTARNQMCLCVSLCISISSQYFWIPQLLKTTLRIHMCPWPPHRSAALMWLQTATYPWAPPPCPSAYSPMAKQSCLRLRILTLSLLQSTATLNQEEGVNVSVYQFHLQSKHVVLQNITTKSFLIVALAFIYWDWPAAYKYTNLNKK